MRPASRTRHVSAVADVKAAPLSHERERSTVCSTRAIARGEASSEKKASMAAANPLKKSAPTNRARPSLGGIDDDRIPITSIAMMTMPHASAATDSQPTMRNNKTDPTCWLGQHYPQRQRERIS